MISRRALFAGAAGAVVAASPVGKALSAPAPALMGLDLAKGSDVTVFQDRVFWIGGDGKFYFSGASSRWISQAEMQENYPNAD